MTKSSNLRPIAVDLLYEGLRLTGDVYDFNASRLLIKAGNVLTPALIEKLRDANKNQRYIYVSQETFDEVREKLNFSDDIVTVDKKLEDETGYTAVVDDTENLVKEIAGLEKMPAEIIYPTSGEIAQRLKKIKQDIAFDIVNALAPADEYLRRHLVNVSILNGLIGVWSGLSDAEVDELILTGLVHDCGKAIIPPEILDAPRRLSLTEFEVIKTHANYSFVLLDGLPDVIRRGVLGHHEKMNGSGYPNNLNGTDIPFYARVTSVSDVYDAMVSRRVYKGPLPPFEVLSILSDMRGTDLDSQIVDLFVDKMPNALAGKQTLMSNGEIGKLSAADPDDIAYPFVILNGQKIKTNKDLYCVSMI